MTFVAGSQHFAVNPTEMGVTVDWGAQSPTQPRQGDGSGVVRGFRRLALRFSPAEIEPVVHAYGAAVNYEVGLLGSKVDRPHREARLVRHGLTIQTIGGESGLELQRAQAAKLLVASLASLTRHRVVLPVQVDPPTLTIAQLKAARVQARRMLSAPVSLALDGKTTTTLTPKQLAPMLQLPREPGCGADARRRGCKRLLREARPSGRPPRARRHVRRQRRSGASSCPPSTGWLSTCRARPPRC